ncbi:MAG TPA: arginine-ornithine antiporter [Coxiellaceae bacterium]|nr:MAG: arginine-ornithine antiporter [Gammaproteobacteria bacterium RBG_16_37_9]HBC72100.1 arginine-ornithine antiporter [Coxiellaceae bacterium]HBY55253.1 arginine-ornithine antiporter [Coxiellaceae bacterium]
MLTKDNKLGLYALIAMCIGSMIGAGLFALPQVVASSTGVVALLVAWTITFSGMFCLAKVFQNLSMRRPDLDVGIYAYAKEGLGNYFGFNSAWGYWLSAWLGNISYVMMLCTALSLFFPIFGDETSFASLILSSVFVWGTTYLCLIGVRSAAMVNVVVTIAKIIPIFIFIVIVAYAFNSHTFTADIWQIAKLGSITSQVKSMMLVTVWIFVGIEGASVFSARARNRRDVGRATIISFIVMFLILFAVSVLPFGVLSQTELASLQSPSTGALLAHIIGPWGGVFMNIGVIIAVSGALLAWILIAAEVPYVAGKKDGLFPQVFASENKAYSPSGSLLITAVCQQLYLIVAHFYKSGYLATISLAASTILLPYLFSAFYASLLAFLGKTYEEESAKERVKDLLISLVAIVYGIWLFYAAAGKYLLLTSILYFVGSIVFIFNKRRRKQKVFNKYEVLLFLIISVLGIGCVVALVMGKITL